MKQHKWHKEIKAWADGLDVEMSFDNGKSWEKFDDDWVATDGIEYRIKPQPKEPQYLYVYLEPETGNYKFNKSMIKIYAKFYIGKIKLEVDDEKL